MRKQRQAPAAGPLDCIHIRPSECLVALALELDEMVAEGAAAAASAVEVFPLLRRAEQLAERMKYLPSAQLFSVAYWAVQQKGLLEQH